MSMNVLNGPGLLGQGLCQSPAGEGYFNGTSSALLNSYVNMRNQTSFSFRTCEGGTLLYQKKQLNPVHSIKIALDKNNGSLLLSLTLQSTTSDIYLGNNLNNNQWYTLNLQYRLGTVSLSVGNYETVVAMENGLNSYFLTLDVVDSGMHIGAVRDGDNYVDYFTGCISEGPSVLLSRALSSKNVVWGECPLTTQPECDVPTDPDQCASIPCANGGVCTDLNNAFRCTCPSRYTGNTCSVDTGPLCDKPEYQLSCQNGGFCKEEGNANYTVCQCPSGYEGKYCEISDIDYCSSRPCKNNGLCTNNTFHDGFQCTCQKGFAGITCDININECHSQPCQNNGICQDGIDNYTCDCTNTGYEGANCESDINECTQNPCQNDAACFNNYGSYMCQCPYGFGGQNCEQKLDPCMSSPCLNGAVCQGEDFYTCECADGFEGVNCQVNTDECAGGNPCDSPYQCVDGVNNYTCVCPPGTTDSGTDCIDIDECTSIPCQNGATCQNGDNMYTCDCPSGYAGEQCDQEMNECASNPCQNGATCQDQIDGYTCMCVAGYDGSRCDNNIDECSSTPCYNNATCTDGINGYSCVCQDGYAGERCRLPVDECLSNPCGNGATCNDEIAGYTCSCVLGFEGVHCETNIDECADDPCLNSGTCVDDVNDFSCTCTSEWTGKTCNIEYDVCIALTPCQNGATCNSIGQSQDYTCTCVRGFIGDNCETDIDDCATATCNTGEECHDLVNGYECRCPNGFEGANCASDINECDNSPCLNGATCVNFNGGYNCTCMAGFAGVNCETDIDECASQPCMNGAICQQTNDASYRCFCVPGFHGDNCDVDVDECLSNPCLNGATCEQSQGKFLCHCAPGFEGDNCQIDIDECESNPCQNGATCEDLVNGYECHCVPGYNGSQCEFEIDECDSNPCQNQGQCTDQINRFICDCTNTGFYGVLCENNIDDCVNVTCQNGAVCQDLIKDYQCQCYDGYTGRDCETDIDDCASRPCLNGAVCLERSNRTLYNLGYFNDAFNYSTASGFTCQCQPGFRDDYCETNIDECESSPCTNGGTCMDLNNGYECQCSPGWEGTHCEEEINECESNPCENGGTCTDKFNAFECQCTTEYAGRQCSVLLIGCNSGHACQNGATCVPFLQYEPLNIHNYTCTCLAGFTGYYCGVSTAASYTGNSYMKDTSTNNQNSIDISLGFRTTVLSGLLLFSGESPDDYGSFAVELYDGRVYARYGTSTQTIETRGLGISRLNDADWHDIQMIISGNSMILQLHDAGCPGGVCEDVKDISSVTLAQQRQFASTFIGGIESGIVSNSRSQQNFIGCTRDVTNGESGDVLLPTEQNTVISGCTRINQCDPDPCNEKGDCIDGWIDYQCVCYHGYTGPNCNFNFTSVTLSFEDSNSYMLFRVATGPPSSIQIIKLNFRTTKPSGLIFYLTTTDQNQFVVLQLVDGQLQTLVKVGSNSILSTSVGQSLADGDQHYVEVIYTEDGNHATLQVQLGTKTVTSRSSAGITNVNYIDVYIGGVPDFNSVASTFITRESFKGCVQDIRHNGYILDAFPLVIPDFRLPESYQLINDVALRETCVSDDMCDDDNPCQNNSTCTTTWNDFECACVNFYRGKDCSLEAFCQLVTCADDATCINRNDGYDCLTSATFDGTSASYITYSNSISQSAIINSISVNLRTRRENQLILHSKNNLNNRNDYMTLEFFNNDVLFRFDFGDGTQIVPVANNISDGEWHVLRFEFETNIVSMFIDGNLRLRKSVTLTTTSLTDFFSADGNVVHLAYAPTGTISSSNDYKGCLEEIRIGDFLLPFYDQDSVNSSSVEQFYATPVGISIGCQGDPVCDSSPCQNAAECQDMWNLYTCNCLPGYDGINCENDIDECASSPCLFGSQCIDHINNYTCVCTPGYIGPNCGIEIDECETTVCQNNGTCQDLVNDFYCNCTSNYTGKNCEYLIPLFQSCSDEPCQNDATCVNVTAENPSQPSFECQCRGGYEGVYCQDEIDYCANVTCENGATCNSITDEQRFECECVPGYTGEYCGTDIDECAAVQCLNGATCRDLINEFQCACLPGYDGTYCGNDIDECANITCENGGTCQDLVNGYECLCLEGYEGIHCENDINECSVSFPCQNGATCTNTDGSYMCTCATGYYGINCERNPCLPYPCENSATCRSIDDLGSNFECLCPVGYKGLTCGLATCDVVPPCLAGNCSVTSFTTWQCSCPKYYEGVRCEVEGPCTNQTLCENGGTCNQFPPYNSTDFNCTCAIGFEGERCQNETNWCEDDPCQNGTCNNYRTGYNCTCDEGWTGDICNMTYCDDDPCENGGTCQNEEDGYYCNCTAGFSGTNCEIDLDECEAEPCENDGQCIDRPGYYECNCTGTGYNGTNCDNDLNECEINPTICKNDAKCINEPGSFRCECVTGFIGFRCEHDDPCYETIDCQNEGECKSGVNATNHPVWNCTCTEDFIGDLCEVIAEPVDDDLNLYIIIGAAAGGLVLILFIILLVFLMSVRSKRATRGTYSPSRQEMTGSRVEMGNVLKPPPEERLI
ncbi:uncharacterized protein LOC144440704 [Glandiceps talaboti]